MKNLGKNHYIIIGIWFLLNLLQAAFTGLHSDESYYWMYSEHLAWGYFDHPPMSAFFIHLGYALLHGQIGVRFILILFSTATFAIILNELNEKKDLFLLIAFVLSFPLVHTHIAGFMALPDGPLLFFTMLFLILYKRFITNPDFWISVLLGAAAAAMIYSKYHAFLIIGLTVLSNIRLLKNKYFYLSAAVALLMLVPHIWWQYMNDFPTFKYHLVERAKPFRLKYVFPNLLNQLLMAGPLTGILILWKLTKVRITGQFERTLIFNILGFYILFFILSFKNRIEAHWSAAIIPMIMFLVYPLISSDKKFRRWFLRLSVPIIALMFLYRLYLALDFLPNVGHAKITFYQRKAHALEIKERANGKYVGFFNNYAAISNYIFYTGDQAVHLSTPGYRYCQYDLWDEEKQALGKDLFTVQPSYLDPPVLEIMVTGEKKGFRIIEDFQPLTGLQIMEGEVIDSTNTLLFNVKLVNTNSYTIKTTHRSNPCIAFMQDGQELFYTRLDSLTALPCIEPGDTITIELAFDKNRFSHDKPLAIYTRTENQVRGEMLSVDPF